jgi:hypothetical protein
MSRHLAYHPVIVRESILHRHFRVFFARLEHFENTWDPQSSKSMPSDSVWLIYANANLLLASLECADHDHVGLSRSME